MRGRRSGRSWEEAGSANASVLDGFHAVVVCGETDEVAAEVALGLARVASERRKVTIADLSGDVAPLKALLDDWNLDGVTEAILYGVSFERLERPVPGSPRLGILPSGSDDVRQEGVYESSRWPTLARKFRKQGSLLLVVASASAPALRALVDSMDGAIVAGTALMGPPPPFLVLKRMPSPNSPAHTRRSAPTREVPAEDPQLMPSGMSHRAYAAAGLAALVVVLAAMAAIVTRSAPEEETRAAAPAPLRVPAAPAADSVIAANPADSAISSAYAVQFLAANTLEGANFELRGKLKEVPAGTISPVPVGPDRVTWYRVVGGAYTDIRSADSLLAAVRRSRLVGEAAGFVVRVPFALLVDSVPTVGGVPTALERSLSRGLPVYALAQPEGNALVYAGAFATPSDAAVLQDSLRSAGTRTLLVYRKGRTP
ncbi:MAG: SPOR domain-containing protein [Gemmatimonadaceae bacterium]